MSVEVPQVSPGLSLPREDPGSVVKGDTRQIRNNDVTFRQQMEKISLWIPKWKHEERCSLLRALMTWSRHRQIQFLNTVSVPATHRDSMYTSLLEDPDTSFIPLSNYHTRKLKTRQELLGRRKDGNNYHRVSSAHLQREADLAEILHELRLPTIPPRLPSRAHTWDGGSGTLSWGITAGGQTTDSGTEDRLEADENLPELGSSGKSKQEAGTTKRSVTWSSRNVKSRDRKEPIRNVHSSQSVALRQREVMAAMVLGFAQNDIDLVRSAISDSRLPENITGESSPSSQYHVTRSLDRQRSLPVERQRSSMSLQSLRDRKREKHLALRRSKTDLPSDASSRVSSDITNTVLNRSAVSRGSQGAEIPGPVVSPEGEKVIQWYLAQWNDAQRNEFLHKFLMNLNPRQQYFISTVLAVKTQKDFITLLPQPIALKILSYLSIKQILKASLVCKQWYKLCNSNKLWKVKCCQTQLAIPVLSEKPKWKKIYQENRNIKANWEQGKCKVLDCKGHTDRVLSVTFDERRMATGSVDKMIRIWSLESGRCLHTLKGHLRGIWCLKFFGKNLLISGSYDCSIKVWNLRSGKCVRTLLGHEGPVWALAWRGTKLVSGAHDKTARVWDSGRCYLLHTLRGHHGAVYCIDMDEKGDIVITGSSDKTVRLWSAETGTQQLVIRVSDKSAVMAVSWSHQYLACSFWDTIAVYRVSADGSHAKRVQKYEEHYKRIESLELSVDPERGKASMISGGRDGELKYWDIAKEQSIQTYKGHSRTINCVHCDAFRIATASYDNKIKIWDFRSTE